VTIAVFSVVDDPYAVVVPYSTWLSDASSVVQPIVAPAVVMAVALTPLMTGGVVSGPGGRLPTSADQPAPPRRLACCGSAVVSPATVPVPSLNFQLATSEAGELASSAR
jgi:hypothetical protein